MKKIKKITAAAFAALMIGSTVFTSCNMAFDENCAEMADVSTERVIKENDVENDEKSSGGKKVAVSKESWALIKAKDEVMAQYAKVSAPFEGLSGVKGGTTKLLGLILGAADTEKCSPFEKTVLSIGGNLLTTGAKMVDALIDKFTYGMGSIVIDFFWPEEQSADPVQVALADMQKSIDGISEQLVELDATVLNMFAGQYKQNHFVNKGTLNTTLTKAETIVKNGKGCLTYHDYNDLKSSLPSDFLTKVSHYYVNYVSVTTPYTLPMAYRVYAEKTYPFRWQSNNMLKAFLAQDLSDGTKYKVVADEIMNPFNPNVALETLIAAVENDGYNRNTADKVAIKDDIRDIYLSFESEVNAKLFQKKITEEECLKQKLMFIADLAKDPAYRQNSGKTLYQLYVEALEAVKAEFDALTSDYDKYVAAIDFDIIPKQEADTLVINYFEAGNEVEYIKLRNAMTYLNYGLSIRKVQALKGLDADQKDKVLHGMIPSIRTHKSGKGTRVDFLGWKDEAKNPYEKLLNQKVIDYVMKAYEKLNLTDGKLTWVNVYGKDAMYTKESGKEIEKNLGNILYYDGGLTRAVVDNSKLVLSDNLSISVGGTYTQTKISFKYYDLGRDGKAGVQQKTISSSDYTNYDNEYHEFRTLKFSCEGSFDYNVKRY